MPFEPKSRGGKTSKVPGLFFHKPSKQYLAHVGLNRILLEPELQRIPLAYEYRRATQYLGRDEAQAIIRYLKLKQEWGELTNKARQKRKEFIAMGLPQPRHATVWWPTEDEQTLDANQTIDRFKEEVNFVKYGEDRPAVTLLEVQKAYLVAYEKRVGLKGNQGIKQKTAENTRKMLELSMKKASASDPNDTEVPIDPNMVIHDIKKQHLTDFVNYWWDGDLEISERTALNYCRAFKSLLDWIAGEEDMQWTMPKGADDVFSFKMSDDRNIAKYDKVKIKKLINGGSEQLKLYSLMALNFGWYQGDIAAFNPKFITHRDGEMYIKCKRVKTSHQNKFETEWWVWPETRRLMEKYRAKENPLNLYFLNGNGRPLVSDETKYDSIRDMFDTARTNSEVDDYSFKQFRKIGFSAVKRITLNPDIARMYAAQKVTGAAARYDADDFFDPMHEALKKWRTELIADGVLK